MSLFWYNQAPSFSISSIFTCLLFLEKNKYKELLIDSWENQESIDFHHQSPMMNKIAELRDKYNLHMKVERYQSEDTIPDNDQKYIRNWQIPVCLIRENWVL